MAQVPWGIGMAVKTQSGGFGSPITFATAGTLNLVDGIVLGDAGSGIALSGIDMEISRVETPLAPITGSFTPAFPIFIRRDVTKLTIAIPARGHCANVSGTPADADFDPLGAAGVRYPGMDALLQSAGLLGAARPGGAIGWTYSPANAAPCTVKIWIGSGTDTVLYIFQDCVAKLTMDETPGGTGVWTFELSGTVTSITPAITFPTFVYGVVATTSAPVVQNTANSFGLSGGMTVRGFTEMKIVIDNQIAQIPDSNQPGGQSPRQTGRSITLTAEIYADAVTEGYEDSLLGSAVASTDFITFNVGAATGASQPQLSYVLTLFAPNVTKEAPDRVGPSVARKIELAGTGITANTEFSLILA